VCTDSAWIPVRVTNGSAGGRFGGGSETAAAAVEGELVAISRGGFVAGRARPDREVVGVARLGGSGDWSIGTGPGPG